MAKSKIGLQGADGSRTGLTCHDFGFDYQVPSAVHRGSDRSDLYRAGALLTNGRSRLAHCESNQHRTESMEAKRDGG